jgi:hypothetical protein
LSFGCAVCTEWVISFCIIREIVVLRCCCWPGVQGESRFHARSASSTSITPLFFVSYFLLPRAPKSVLCGPAFTLDMANKKKILCRSKNVPIKKGRKQPPIHSSTGKYISEAGTTGLYRYIHKQTVGNIYYLNSRPLEYIEGVKSYYSLDDIANDWLVFFSSGLL